MMHCPHCDKPLPEAAQFCVACGKRVVPEETPATPGHPLIGVLLQGKYQIVKILGEGGMGTVYEATQTLGATVRHVAVKTLHAHLATDASLRTRFERECAVLARVSHPNTVQLIDYGVAATSQGAVAFLVMELVSGPSLRDLIEKEAPLEATRALSILRQIGGALSEAHAAGVVHRDLKPENIILIQVGTQRDFVKLLDFGIAKNDGDSLQEKLTQHGAVLGTPAYMSPEQLLGDPVDVRSDIFSLGLIAYEMLRGRLPFRPAEPWQLMSQRLTAEPEPFDGALADTIPLAMQNAVFQAIRRRADERFSTANAFVLALEGMDAPEMTVAAPAAPKSQAHAFARTELPELPRPRSGTLPSGTALEEEAKQAFGRIPAGATEVPDGPVYPPKRAFSQMSQGGLPQGTHTPTYGVHPSGTESRRQHTWPIVVFILIVLGGLGGLGALAANVARNVRTPDGDTPIEDSDAGAADAFVNGVDLDDATIPGLEEDARTRKTLPFFDAAVVGIPDATTFRDAFAALDVHIPLIPDTGVSIRDAGRRRRDGGRWRPPWFHPPPRTPFQPR